MPIHCDHLDGGIAVIEISKPERRNALDLEMFESLAAQWERLAVDASVRCVLLTGSGAKAFCAGADLSEHLDRRPGIDDLVDRALLKTTMFPKPIVAAIRGACVAGGLELALAVDIRIASDDAQFGLPEVRWGIVPSGGGAMKLCDQIGLARAMDMLLTGRMLHAEEAERIGLVSQRCASRDVAEIALERARAISANSANAVAAVKRIALGRRASEYARAEADERHLVELVRGTGDPEEGKRAFLEKRKPRFGPIARELSH